MSKSSPPQRPGTGLPVMLTLIMAMLQIAVGAQNATSPDLLPAVALNIGLGVVLLVSAFLIARYKRIGVILCLIIYLYLLLSYAIVIASGGAFDIISLIAVVAIVIVLYYLYRYLVGANERHFFT
ncbi:MAG TPA: hypothetical protein VHD90_04490 [Phototrophicaceae bacterium]|nr:hypothetical protein [Phototrophicaceae bacterium]